MDLIWFLTVLNITQTHERSTCRSVNEETVPDVADVRLASYEVSVLSIEMKKSKTCTRPETNCSHLKIDGLECDRCLLGWSIFRGCVSFWEGILVY